MKLSTLRLLAVLLLFLADLGAQGADVAALKGKVRDIAREKGTEARAATVESAVATKDPTLVPEFLAAIRTADAKIDKNRSEIASLGKQVKELWKQIDDQLSKGRAVTVGTAAPIEKKAKELEAKMAQLDAELVDAETVTALCLDGAGRLLAGLDGLLRAKSIIDIADAVERQSKVDDKVLFVKVLGATPTAEARASLLELVVRSQEPAVRAAACDGLGRLGDASAMSVLGKALNDETWSVQVSAARALADIGSLDALAPLADALPGKEGRVLDEIVEALEDLTGITFFDNATLWKDFVGREAANLKKIVADIDASDPLTRGTAITSVGDKGLLAGVRRLLAVDGMVPAVDGRRRLKGPPPEVAKAAGGAAGVAVDDADFAEARRAAVGKAISSRPKLIAERAAARLIAEPLARANATKDFPRAIRYTKAAGPVKHEAVRSALNRLALEAPFGPQEKDEEARRLAAVESLGHQDDDSAVLPLQAIIAEVQVKASSDVRAAACTALGRLRRKDGVPSLVSVDDEKGKVGTAAVAALKDLAGKDIGTTRDAWNTWWLETGRKLPTLIEKKKDDETAKGEDGAKKGSGTTFYGIETRSKRIMYILDISGSMNEADAATGAQSRLNIAKREMIASLRSLPDDAMFGMIFFNHDFTVWKPKMANAKENRADAVKFIEGIKATGPTNIFDPLEKAFEMAGRGTFDKRYTVTLDTIFLMSDGQPNRGRLVEPRQIVSEMQRMNDLKKVKIHCVGVGKDHDAEFMKRLARLTGGTYVAR